MSLSASVLSFTGHVCGLRSQSTWSRSVIPATLAPDYQQNLQYSCLFPDKLARKRDMKKELELKFQTLECSPGGDSRYRRK
jgi:hypothetical protein